MADYDPHDHRKVEKPLSNLEAFMNLLKANLGSGVVALPIGFKYAGWSIGLIAIVLIMLLIIHSMKCLIHAEYRLCKRLGVPLLVYYEAMKAAAEVGPPCCHGCSSFVKTLIIIFLVLVQIGTCMSYAVFGGGVLKAFVDSFQTKDQTLSKVQYLLIIMIPYFFNLFVRDLKDFAYLSLAANLAIIFSFLLSFRFIFVDPQSFSSLNVVGDFTMMPMFFSAAIFSMLAVGMITQVEYQMEEPKKFGGILGVFPSSMYVLTGLYIIVGFCGYWKYGANIKGNFILNLPPTDTITRIINCIMFFAMIISYGANLIVGVEIIWYAFLDEKVTSKKFLYNFILRIVLFVITFSLSIGIPSMILVVSLTGAITQSSLGLVFPMVIDILERYEEGYGTGRWILIKDLLVLIIGVACFVLGSYATIYEATKSLTAD